MPRMPDLISEDRANGFRSLTRKAAICWSLLACAGCSVQIFARVDDPVRAEGITLALDDHQCEFADNSDSGDEPTLDLDLVFHVSNDASARTTVHPSRIYLTVRGRSYPPDAFSRDLIVRPRSQKDFHVHFSYDGDVSCAANMAVTIDHVIELNDKDLTLRPLTFQPSDQDAD
jgi:hypothetical protein